MSYVHLARSSFNDEEMFQMLAQNPPFGEIKLRRHFRKTRGLIFSKNLETEALAQQCARLGFSWSQFDELATNLDSEASGDKRSSIKLPCALSQDVIEQALANIREKRKDEKYLVTNRPSSLDIRATYIKTDFTKSKSRQREKKSLGIAINLTETDTEIEYDSEDRNCVIVADLIKEIRKASTGKVVPSECEILFVGGDSEEKQTNFFLALINNIDGYSRISVSDVKVNRAGSKAAPSSNEGIKDEQKKKEAIKGLVRLAVLRGEDVTGSKMFQLLMKDQYFISGISWLAREVGGDRRKVELEAGFREDQVKARFFADAHRIFEKNSEGEDEATARRIPAFQRLSLQKKIIAAAYRLHEVSTPTEDE